MRCCVLPITSSARKPVDAAPSAPGPRSRPPGDAAARFEGMLFASALAPLSQALGVLGDVLTDAMATAVARGSQDDFYRRLQALTDAAGDDGHS
jgi:hypothetical protein